MPRQEPGEPYYRITLEEAEDMYGQEDTVVIDVRRPDEYEGVHVREAIHIPVDDLLARIDELPKDKKLLFICAAGVRSGLASEMAAAMGFDTDTLFNIEDGTPAWTEKGLPVSRGNEK